MIRMSNESILNKKL